MSADITAHSPEEMVRQLQEELEQTNREVMQLTLELETRLEQLRTAEERYRRLAENAPDLIYRYDLRAHQSFTFVNPQAEPITGYTPEEFYRDVSLLPWRGPRRSPRSQGRYLRSSLGVGMLGKARRLNTRSLPPSQEYTLARRMSFNLREPRAFAREPERTGTPR